MPAAKLHSPTPTPWNVSYEKRGHMGDKPDQMKKFVTIEACKQPAGINGRSLVMAEMRVGDESFGFGDNKINHRVSQEEAEANAAFIVLAVNSHESMRQSLMQLIACLQAACSYPGTIACHADWQAVINDARAALESLTRTPK